MNRLASRSQLRASFVRWALLTVPAVVLLGFLAGRLGGGADSVWFEALIKPSIFPPPIWFAIVWTILYLMLGFALALVCAAWGARGRTAAITVFMLQLAVKLGWTPLFFGAHQITGALILITVLDVLVIITIAMIWRVRKLAAWLMFPYLAWILFATVLNYEFLRLNPDADDIQPTPTVQRIEI